MGFGKNSFAEKNKILPGRRPIRILERRKGKKLLHRKRNIVIQKEPTVPRNPLNAPPTKEGFSHLLLSLSHL